MYSIHKTQIGLFNAVVLSSNHGERAVIIPDLGGMVHELVVPVLSPSFEPVAYKSIVRGDALEELSRNPYYRGRFMVPFCGRIPQGVYRFQGVEHRLYVNMPEEQNALHGFLYRTSMQLLSTQADESAAELRLHHIIKPDDEAGYSFTLQVIITYRLDDQGFTVTITVANLGKEALPVTLGWHPYFMLDGALSDWQITMDADLYYPTKYNLIPTGALLAVGGTSYDFRAGRPLVHAQLDTCFAFPSCIQLEHTKTHVGISMEIDRQVFNRIHVFIPPERDAVAVEPVSAAGSAFTMPHLGLTVLRPATSKTGWVRVQAFMREN